LKGSIVVADVGGVLTGTIEFSASGDAPLDFDPTGQVVTIEQAGTVLLSRAL
jgi:hypothetical protein